MQKIFETAVPSLAVAVLTLLSLLAAGCKDDGPVGMGPGGPWGGGRPAAVVETAPVEQGAFTVEARFVGTLDATSSADLYARTSGPIVQVNADSGDPVRAGQVLAVIQPDEALERVEQSRAALRIAEATLSQREANLEVAQATANRTETLFEQDLVSQQDYDTVQAELVGARAQLELSMTRLTAPFDGFVGRRFLDLGDFATTNRPVFSVVDLDTIETTVSITEGDAARIHVGQPAKIRARAAPGRVFEGRVARIASIFDPQTNTTEAEIEIDNAGGVLKPGMFADVAVTYRTEPTALLVPTSAVIEGERESHVFVAQRAAGGENGASGGEASKRPAAGGGPPEGPTEGATPGPQWVARRVPVRVLGTGTDTGAGERTAIEPESTDVAFSPGTRVVVLGQQALSDGAPITLSEGPAENGPSLTADQESPS
ncbi:MAG TPA: efflux RND transporter periplasmic adaptor subunit [Thermoanaerobaculia bacterium]